MEKIRTGASDNEAIQIAYEEKMIGALGRGCLVQVKAGEKYSTPADAFFSFRSKEWITTEQARAESGLSRAIEHMAETREQAIEGSEPKAEDQG